MIAIPLDLRISLRGHHNHLAAARPHLFNVADDFVVLTAFGGDEHHRHPLADECDRAMLHFGGGHSFGMDVADFLQLQRPFQRDRIMVASPQEQPVLLLAEFAGVLGDLCALLQHDLHLIGNVAERLDQFLCLMLAGQLPPTQEQRQHRQHRALAGERLGGSHTNLRTRMQIDAGIGFAGDG